MPYIPQKRRYKIIAEGDTPYNAGELNFQISDLIGRYQDSKGLCYRTINDIIGALEGAKLEYYRRVAQPYENSKLAEHGDVYNGDVEVDS